MGFFFKVSAPNLVNRLACALCVPLIPTNVIHFYDLIGKGIFNVFLRQRGRTENPPVCAAAVKLGNNQIGLRYQKDHLCSILRPCRNSVYNRSRRFGVVGLFCRDKPRPVLVLFPLNWRFYLNEFSVCILGFLLFRVPRIKAPF